MIAWTKAGYKLRAISMFLCMYDEFTSCLFSSEFMKECCPLIHAKCLQNNILKTSSYFLFMFLRPFINIFACHRQRFVSSTCSSGGKTDEHCA